jgi:hypothetical protein
MVSMMVGFEPTDPVKQRCGNCSAFFYTSANEGECHALPPSIVYLGLGSSPSGGPSKAIVNSYFPPVDTHFWCRLWGYKGD